MIVLALIFGKQPTGLRAEYLVEEEKLIGRWNDNSVVTFVSNRERVESRDGTSPHALSIISTIIHT